jgi:hypothetical protein
MSLYPGKLAYCGIALQGASTTPVTPAKYISIKDMDFGTKPNHTYVTEYRKTMQSSRPPIRDGKETEGNMEVYAYPGGGGLEYLLFGAFGSCTTTPTGTTAKQHTFSVDDDDLPAWTITEGLSSLNTYSYPSCKVKDLKMTLKEKEPVTISASFVGKSVDRRYGEQTPSYSTPRAFTFLDAYAYLDGNASTLVKEMDVTIDRGTEAVWTMDGSQDPTYILPTDCKVSGTLNMFFSSETEYNRFMGNPSATTPNMLDTATPAALKLVLIGDTIESTLTQAVTLIFPEVYYDSMKFKPANESYVEIGFDFTAVNNTSAGYSMSAVVQSSLATVTP